MATAAHTLAGTSALETEEGERAIKRGGDQALLPRGSSAGGGSAHSETAYLPRPPPASGTTTHLAYLIEQCRPCVLRPFCFFVSWQGVLTLAYRGFPSQLVALKRSIPDYYCGLPQESPGSRWPKTTLACLRDGRRLTPEQLATLNRICCECSGVFQAPGSPKQQALLVDRLSVVVYECRSLERQVSKHVVRMRGGAGGGGGGGSAGSSEAGYGSGGGGGGSVPIDASEPSREEHARVEAVVREADDVEAYWVKAAADGNRESHYRGAALGATLVHELGPSFGGGGNGGGGAGATATAPVAIAADPTAKYTKALPDILRRFRARVEVALPGMYAFFEESSLHVTIRAIIV